MAIAIRRCGDCPALGAPYTLCEVMLDYFVLQVKRRRKTHHLLHVADEEHPVGGQLMGAEPEQFGPAARKLVDRGFDVIDINFGCPVKKVLGRCRGGFHLSQPKVALEIVARVREAVPDSIPVTVKIASRNRRLSRKPRAVLRDFRRGLPLGRCSGHRACPDRDATLRRAANWDFLRELKRRAGSRVLLGSGDLFTAQSCVDMLRYTGVDGVTVARGAIGNPWIYPQVRRLLSGELSIDPAQPLRTARSHCRTLPVGRGAIRPGSLRAGHAEVRHQILATPPAA